MINGARKPSRFVAPFVFAASLAFFCFAEVIHAA